MKYFELKCLAYLKKDIDYMDSFDILSKYINTSMSKDKELLSFHEEEKVFKNYSFGSFFSQGKIRIYQKENTYSFTLRSLDEEFVNKMQDLLRGNINNPFLQVLTTNKKTVKKFFISELYSATPVVVSLPRQKGTKQMFWTPKDDIFALQKQLQDNLLKKYKFFYGEDLIPQQNFIQLFEIKNHKLQSIFFTKELSDKKQKVRLFGNKFKIMPNEDEVSQKLAFIALSCGLGEKQSYSAGFVLGKGM